MNAIPGFNNWSNEQYRYNNSNDGIKGTPIPKTAHRHANSNDGIKGTPINGGIKGTPSNEFTSNGGIKGTPAKAKKWLQRSEIRNRGRDKVNE